MELGDAGAGHSLCGSKASCRLHRFGRRTVGSQGLNVNLKESREGEVGCAPLQNLKTVVTLGQCAAHLAFSRLNHSHLWFHCLLQLYDVPNLVLSMSGATSGREQAE